MILAVGFSCAVAGLGFDADEHRQFAFVVLLKPGDIFKGVGGDHTVVMVGGGHQSRRVFDARFNGMVGGVVQEVAEHLLAVGTGAVIGGPGPADGEFMVAEHVHHPDRRKGYLEKVRPLVGDSPHEKPSVRPSLNGQLPAGGVFLADQEFSRGNEIVKDILLLQFGACFVPLFSIFTPAAQIGHGQNTSFSTKKSRCTENPGV